MFSMNKDINNNNTDRTATLAMEGSAYKHCAHGKPQTAPGVPHTQTPRLLSPLNTCNKHRNISGKLNTGILIDKATVT